jgi:hypothetical protein
MDSFYHLAGTLAATASCKSSGGILKPNSLPRTCANNDTMAIVINAFLVLIGALAVLMVVIGAFRYVRAGANETTVAEARRQIIHALVGLVVVGSAAIIVNFIVRQTI